MEGIKRRAIYSPHFIFNKRGELDWLYMAGTIISQRDAKGELMEGFSVGFCCRSYRSRVYNLSSLSEGLYLRVLASTKK